MKAFADKVKEARISLGWSQLQLAREVGVSPRSVQAYERGEKTPRPVMLANLAKALKVSVKFLADGDCDDPAADIEKDSYIEEARERYGAKGARDAERLLADNAALFAGGELSQEQKDAFFQAVMTAYVTCKEEAKAKFGRKDS
ncbi:helix-turn-helix transcriptional regulator [bacterium]|nr:helix-turn-helix transcriptional regulator [bacterium]